jgi:hypothetical protein
MTTLRKIVLTSYTVSLGKGPSGRLVDGKPEILERTAPFDVRASAVNILLTPTRGRPLNGPALRAAGKLADKIENETAEAVLLDEAEWALLRQAADAFENFDAHAREFVDRIYDAPAVPVAENP